MRINFRVNSFAFLRDAIIGGIDQTEYNIIIKAFNFCAGVVLLQPR
jgi:hypothetical protein